MLDRQWKSIEEGITHNLLFFETLLNNSEKEISQLIEEIKSKLPKTEKKEETKKEIDLKPEPTNDELSDKEEFLDFCKEQITFVLLRQDNAATKLFYYSVQNIDPKKITQKEFEEFKGLFSKLANETSLPKDEQQELIDGFIKKTDNIKIQKLSFKQKAILDLKEAATKL